jgi:hypothetical protein
MKIGEDKKLINTNDLLRTEVQPIDSILQIKNNIDTTHIKNLITVYITIRAFGGLQFIAIYKHRQIFKLGF